MTNPTANQPSSAVDKIDSGQRFIAWLNENFYWEDPDQCLQIWSAEGGGVIIGSFDGDKFVEAKTLTEAIEKWEAK